jgi:hypothetical protein
MITATSPASAMYEELEHALIVRRTDSPRLAIIFSGIGQRMNGVAPLEFLKASGLEEINFIVLRDRRRTGFVFGCTPRIPDFDALLAWLDAAIASFPHVNDLFCVGVSSGALPSMVAAEHLHARCSLVFGPRLQALREVAAMFGPHDKAVTDNQALFETGADITSGPTDKARHALWRARERVRILLHRPAREWTAAPILRAAVRDSAALMARVGVHCGTVHHLFYVRSNRRDRESTRLLAADRPNVIVHALRPPAAYPTERPRWDHDVVPLLIAAGTLKPMVSSALVD